MKRLQDDRSSARKAVKRRRYDAAFKRHLVELSLVSGRLGGQDRAGSPAQHERPVQVAAPQLRSLAQSAPKPAAELAAGHGRGAGARSRGGCPRRRSNPSRNAEPRPATALAGVIEIDLPLGSRASHRGGGPGGLARGDRGAVAAMNPLPAGTRVWLAAGVTDMRRAWTRLAALVQTHAEHESRSPVTCSSSAVAVVIWSSCLWWSGRWVESVLASAWSAVASCGRRPTAAAVSSERGAAVDAARRHRLEKPAAHLAAGARRVDFLRTAMHTSATSALHCVFMSWRIALDQLPDDVEQFKRLLLGRDETIAKLLAEIARLKRWRFGRSAERMDAALAAAAALRSMICSCPPEAAARRPSRSCRSRNRRARPPSQLGGSARAGVPRRLARAPAARDHRARAVELHLPDCGAAMRKLGEDISEQLDFIPGYFQVLRHVRPKLSCGRCARMIQLPAPSRPIERGLPAPGLLAQVIVAKYADHCPLYRQQAHLRRCRRRTGSRRPGRLGGQRHRH